MEISSLRQYLEQWWQNLYQRRWNLQSFPFVWNVCEPWLNELRLEMPLWTNNARSPPLSTPQAAWKVHKRGLLRREIYHIHLTLDQSMSICLPETEVQRHQKAIAVTGDSRRLHSEPSGEIIPFPNMLQNTLIRKQSWILTQNFEGVHENILVTLWCTMLASWLNYDK